MRIPAPVRADRGADLFAAALDRAVQDRPADAIEPRAPERDEQAPSEPPTASPTETAPVAPQPDAPVDGDGGDAFVHGDATADGSVTGPEVTETLRRGESERREDAGKGTDSPRTSTTKATSAEPLLAAVAQRGGPAPTPTVGAPAADAGITGVSPSRPGQALTRGLDAGPQASASPARAAATAPVYRSASTAGAELLERSRDSVFKQILMQLDRDGGEMRVRLQPPDLGELDLRLVVEHGNKLSLTIAAERADLTQLLQKHLDELKQTLQASGLEITDAQVQQRSAGSSGDASAFLPRGREAAPADATATAPSLARAGYVSAEGLDFWA